MHAGAFALDEYLERLQSVDRLAANEAGLEAVHLAQAYTIPFENFDILLGRGVSLEPTAIVDKLVRHARGGYCFELNGLLLMALESLGFEARPLLARVHLSGSPSGRGHMVLLVTIGGREWIADVGFGGPGLRAPIPLERERTASQDGFEFRLMDAGVFGTMLQAREASGWKDLYSFDRSHVIAQDIAYGNHFTSTHPSSFFTRSRVAARPTPGGRVSLYNSKLRTITPDSDRESELVEGEPYLDVLREQFGIELDAPYESLRSMP